MRMKLGVDRSPKGCVSKLTENIQLKRPIRGQSVEVARLVKRHFANQGRGFDVSDDFRHPTWQAGQLELFVPVDGTVDESCEL